MARKIRFPLEMEGGTEVRSLEELRTHFSLEKVLFYISSGKLQTWLRDRYLEELAEKIDQLQPGDGDYARQLCLIFGVEYDDSKEADLEKAEERNRKRALLRERGIEERGTEIIDRIAFDQDDLYDLLDEGERTIYLCGDKFSIPLSKTGIRYIGLNDPLVQIESNEIVDFEAKEILMEGIRFDGKYQALMDAQQKKELAAQSKYGEYRKDTDFHFLLSVDESEKAAQLYSLVSTEMSGLKYDIDHNIKKIRDFLIQEKIAGLGKDYINRL